MIHLVLLSGGSGSRLWPLSNSARSKQFLKVLRDGQGNHVSMAQRVFGQITKVNAEVDVTIATAATQENSIRTQIDGDYNLVLEPCRRDTAPAIMLACANMAFVQGAADDDSVIVMPIDTFAGQDYYDRIVDIDEAIQSGVGDLVLLGVCPTEPSEKFGYIIPEAGGGRVMRVAEFKEKPDAVTAEGYITQGALWNCGVFGFKLGYLRNLTKKYADFDTYEAYVEHYKLLPKNSFDYEVVEKAASVAVIPYSGEWKDLGTWNALTEEMSEYVRGRAIVAGNSNVHIVNETGLPMVVAGLEDAVVVATHDGILACSKEASQSIKSLVESAGEARPMYERRWWGEYRVLDSHVYGNGRNVLTKELIIATGKQLSYQRHAHRSEIWTVVAGRGEVVLNDEVRAVEAGSVVDIQPMQMHAVRSFEDLHIIEVQLGFPLIEEDIERFGNYWEEQA